MIGTLDFPLDHDESTYSTELFLSTESGYSPELADSSNLISFCQAQEGTPDIFQSDILKGRGLYEDTFDLFQEASNDKGSPAACRNTETRGSSSGSGSQNNNNDQNNRTPSDQEPKGTGLLDINSKEDEELCPTELDGIKQAPLCCWSVRNVIGSFRKYACFTGK